MIKEKKLHEEHFSYLKNKNLISFILKCVDINERKRMSLEEF